MWGDGTGRGYNYVSELLGAARSAQRHISYNRPSPLPLSSLPAPFIPSHFNNLAVFSSPPQSCLFFPFFFVSLRKSFHTLSPVQRKAVRRIPKHRNFPRLTEGSLRFSVVFQVVFHVTRRFLQPCVNRACCACAYFRISGTLGLDPCRSEVVHSLLPGEAPSILPCSMCPLRMVKLDVRVFVCIWMWASGCLGRSCQSRVQTDRQASAKAVAAYSCAVSLSTLYHSRQYKSIPWGMFSDTQKYYASTCIDSLILETQLQ